MRVLKKIIQLSSVVLICLASINSVSAQYYSWGADRASLRWSRLKYDNFDVIFPDSAQLAARSLGRYVEAAQPYISYGFEWPALEIPFIVHPDNLQSNGMVMWAPKRVEILSAPDIDGYSMIWLKQLAAHEYRHAVQYNNLNKSTLKWLTYILGEQGATVGLLLPPLYALEGDAVLSETQMSTYGRALQPSFTMGYRAMGDDVVDPKNVSKLKCGSYKEFIPDHYRLGYQIIAYAYDKYNENILNRALWYSARNPYLIVPYDIALSKYYDTSTKKLITEAFTELNSLWALSRDVEPSSQIIAPIDKGNYTTYSHPIALENNKVLALKTDYETPSRFVIVDSESAEEQRIAFTGSISTRPSYAAGRVWWSEYRRSMLFEEDIDSRLCYMDIDEGKPRTVKGRKSSLYPTPIGGSKTHIAYVEYSIEGSYAVVELMGGKEIKRHQIDYPSEIHSLAWDNATQALYLIVTDDDGMSIARLDDDGFTPITKAAFITISNLRAKDGVLYFGSIASGKDEAHSLDLTTGEESQITLSQYGAFQPDMGDDNLYLTSYDRYGYHLAKQSSEKIIEKIEYSLTPKNILNPERKKWNVINLDTVRFDSLELSASEHNHKAKRYSKASHLANIHSWAPISYNPYTLMSELDLNFDIGATLVSQNLLSSCDGFLSYGWNQNYGSLLRAGVNYNGLGVDISLSATYGGEQMAYYVSDVVLGKYKDLSLSASLPLYFQRGYRTQILTPNISWSYSNGIVPKGLETYTNIKGDSYITYEELIAGLNKNTIGITYSDYVRAATRDVDVPLGIVLSASYSANLINPDFSSLLSLYAKIYTPGFGRNDSFTLAGGYQNIYGGYRWIDGSSLLSYKSSILVPTGYTYYDINNVDYYATAANYQFTMCYPEVAITPLIYVKRLRLNLGANYATFTNTVGGRSNLYSYGVDLISDMNIISMTAASTTALKLSFYMPQSESLYFQVGLSLPF